MLRMAEDAGLSPSAISGIIKQGRGATPETIKAIADKWGTIEDYVEMMRLAGHPLPDELLPVPASGVLKESRFQRYLEQQIDKDPTLGDLLQIYNELPPEGRKELVAEAKKLARQAIRDKMRRLGLLPPGASETD